ncbi:MAG: hypothetical protein ACP5I4_01675 [Oceanipulchritudo sp.]
MRWNGTARLLPGWLVWLVTAGLPVLGFWLLLHERVRSQDHAPGPGWAMLALPVALARKSDWLAGWQALACPPAESPPPPGEEKAVDPSAGPPGRNRPEPFRVRFFGEVRQGGDPLYLFFDTEQGRWFRLRAGERDPGAGVALLHDPTGGNPLVRDHGNGRLYRIEPGRHQLLPVESPDRP